MEDIGNFISDIAVKILDKYQEAQVQNLFKYAIEKEPSLQDSIPNAKNSQDLESIFRQVSGIIDADAGLGSIEIDSALINALKCASFNHSAGTITIDDSVIQAPRLITGGADGATGTTTISGTNLKSKGTEIRMGKNCSIRISGNARIVQN